ncbi:hypothetical protein ALP60_00877 [Pseudomonas savastanoi]|uniref:ABC transmembrane type-1 domain-containing protein n=1 Tax=Pseudomonas savastanoi TaxID=29438 RepID=A0A3M5GS38_PSESS|nr:hypothetical protein ALP60_00877 [Pseudomonas savastanoi]
MSTSSGKTAIVTGASSGIGRATAEALVRSVYTVFGTSRKIGESATQVSMRTCDVTDDDSVSALVSSVLAQTGRIDLLYDIPPVTGFMLIDTLLSDEQGAFLDALHHLILPAIVLGTIPLAVIARMTRSSMLEVLREDYVRTARAKGLSPARVVFVHGLRNALIPVLTVFGLQIGILLAGAVLTETIFSWPGIGKWLIEAIGARDYPVVQNGILLIACLVILVNFVVDILYGFANPRIRHQR